MGERSGEMARGTRQWIHGPGQMGVNDDDKVERQQMRIRPFAKGFEMASHGHFLVFTSKKQTS